MSDLKIDNILFYINSNGFVVCVVFGTKGSFEIMFLRRKHFALTREPFIILSREAHLSLIIARSAFIILSFWANAIRPYNLPHLVQIFTQFYFFEKYFVSLRKENLKS